MTDWFTNLAVPMHRWCCAHQLVRKRKLIGKPSTICSYYTAYFLNVNFDFAVLKQFNLGMKSNCKYGIFIQGSHSLGKIKFPDFSR